MQTSLMSEILMALNSKNIKAVSFDIFETIIIRKHVYPREIFKEMFYAKPNCFPEGTTLTDWCTVRTVAEQEARNCQFEIEGHREVYLKDIYGRLPDVYSNKEELMELELLTEISAGIVNDEIYDVIKELRKKSISIVYISDMYLYTEQIRKILSLNGFESLENEKIYVSCVEKKSKSKGDLFDYVIDELNIQSNELLHIGDNIRTDWGVPNEKGINVILYDFISSIKFRYPFREYEDIFFKANITHSLELPRLLADKTNDGKDEEEKFWYSLGAMIVGPLWTCASEWVLNEAIEDGINVIRPIMREGCVISELLCEAAKYRSVEMSIEPIYLSRFAIYSALFCEVTAKEIKVLVNTVGLKLIDILKMLKVDEYFVDYSEYFDSEMIKLKTIEVDENESLYDEIYNRMVSDEIIDIIRKRNEESLILLKEYLEDKKMSESFVAVDVGWTGKMMSSLDDIVKRCFGMIQSKYLLFYGKSSLANYARNGCNLKGFVTMFSDPCDDICIPFNSIYEMFFLCNAGTTIGYKRYNGKVVPVTEVINYPKKQVHLMELLQKGARAFQREYLKLKGIGKIPYSLSEQKDDAARYVSRLLRFPTLKESMNLRQIVFDQNMGKSQLIPVLSESTLTEYSSNGEMWFYSHQNMYERTWMQWYQALQSIKDPLFYLENYCIFNGYYRTLSLVKLTKAIIENAGNDKIVLVSCGANTQKILIYLNLMMRLDRVEGIVDNNSSLVGTEWHGIKVYAVDHCFDSTHYFITTLKKGAYFSLRKQLTELKGNISITGFFEEKD